jgi:hypothetical protein
LLLLIFHFAITTIGGGGGGGGGGHRVAQSELLQEHLLILAIASYLHNPFKTQEMLKKQSHL